MSIIAKAPRNTTPAGRFYDTPAGKFPSVTTILSVIGKPALIAWAANEERKAVVNAAATLYCNAPVEPKMSREAYEASLVTFLGKEKAHTKLLEKAGSIGTAVHALIEWNLRKRLGQTVGPQPALPLEATSCFAAYEHWEVSAELKPVAIEQVVWSASRGYAGTMDVLGEVTHEGKRVMVVLDWKTSARVYKEAHMQVSAYCAALLEMGHASQPLHGLIVRLPKTTRDPEPEFQLVHADEQPGHMEAFMAALRLWQWQQEA